MGKRIKLPASLTNTLFGRAANLCTICGRDVTSASNQPDEQIAVFGEVAHIIAIASDGPRGNASLSNQELNSYDNLILLCANCHTVIDKQELTYTAEELRRIKQLHERRVSSLSTDFPQKKHLDIISRYTSEFQYAYGFARREFEMSSYKRNNVVSQFSDEQFATLAHDSCVIVGESGQGKSMLSFCIASAALSEGTIPIVIEAAQFSRQIKPAFAWSVQTPLVDYFEEIDLACTVLKKKVLLVIDGYNECPPELRSKLNLWISSFAILHKANVIITSQQNVGLINGVEFSTIEIMPPSLDERKQIAMRVNGQGASDRILHLVKALKTRLECKLAGELIDEIKPTTSRYALYDCYVRKRLTGNSVAGIQVLCLVAQLLDQRISFTLSEIEYSRLLATQNLIEPTEYLFTTGILVRRGDRISFAHELFLDAYTAEAIVRFSANSVSKIIDALSSPRNAYRSTLILGAIDDDDLLNSLLSHVTSHRLLADCLMGDCGTYAREWVVEKCQELLLSMTDEAKSFSFNLTESKPNEPVFSSVELNESSLNPWTPQEVSLIHAIPIPFIKGSFTKQVFEWVAAVDQKFANEFHRLRPAAVERKIGIRDDMFSQLFIGVWSRKECSTTMFFKNFNNNGWNLIDVQPSDELYHVAREKLKEDRLSYGQLYLILLLVKQFRFKNHNWQQLSQPHLLAFLSERWKFLPHHLKNIVLDEAAQYAWDGPTESKQPIIDALNALLAESHNAFTNTSIIDALKSLGALVEDEKGYEEAVRKELEFVFSDAPIDERRQDANGMFHRTYDHPYDGAYWAVLSELSPEHSAKFRILALEGAPQGSDFGTGYLMCQVSLLPNVDLSIIERFANLPDVNDHMPQVATEICLLAHLILGHFNHSLPSKGENVSTDAAKALASALEILYWTNRTTVNDAVKSDRIERLWSALLDHQTYVSAGVLFDLRHATYDSTTRFSEGKEIVYILEKIAPDRVADICRQALVNLKNQRGYFEDSHIEVGKYAIETLGAFGLPGDLKLLKSFCLDQELSSSAIAAIERIEKGTS